MNRRLAIALGLLGLLPIRASYGQAVAVSVALEQAQIEVGETTRLHVYAQIISSLRPSTDRIFSWYVDLLNDKNSTAQLDLSGVLKPSADQNPKTSSSGAIDPEGNLRGVFDTFIKLSGAGRDTPVELFSIPIKGVAAGNVILNVDAGTTVPQLAADFIVAPLGGGDPLLGGDYSAAHAEISVTAPQAPPPQLFVALTRDPQTQQLQASLSFQPLAEFTYTIQYRDKLDTQTAWQALPGAPHNSGKVVDPISANQRFYRLRVE